MFEELETGVALRDLITEILRDGPRSISQVGKGLHERGLKLHRLAVAGYLKALADMGVLEEREIPPAKTYALRPVAARKDIYRTAAERSREAATRSADVPRVFLQTLTDLFHRPIFREEFVRAGLEPPPEVEEVSGDERQAARRFLSRSPLKLPFNDPAYRPRNEDAATDAAVRDRARAALAALVRDEFGAGSLAMTTKQATLGSDA